MTLGSREISGIRHSVARLLLVVGAFLLAWALSIVLTGGFSVNLGDLRISSRKWSRPLLLGAFLCLVAWWIHYRHRPPAIRETWIPALRGPLIRAIVAAAAAGLFLCGSRFGVRAAAGSDGFGYVSQSALWLNGPLRIDQRVLASLPWPNAEHTFASLGYRVGAEEYVVPTYPAGTAMLMALGRAITPRGPYLVGPICGALLVLFTFLVGRRVFSRGAGAAAAVLVACSPTVVLLTLSTSADIPAAACWMGAFAAAVGGRRQPYQERSTRGVLLAGALTGLAILVRPNLVFLAVFPWLAAIARSGHAARALRATLWFATASVPFALLVGAIDDYLYGSPLRSGYGNLGPGFSLRFAAENVVNYPAWWLSSQGVLAFFWVLAIFRSSPMRRERLILAGFAACVGLSYLFYLPFHDWSFLRFGLPAIGIAFLFTADLVDWIARGRVEWRVVGFAGLIVAMGIHAVHFSRAGRVLASGERDHRYVVAGLDTLTHTPPEAVVLTVEHSGSIRYYSGRLTMRWDMLEPEWLDRAIEIFRRKGVPVYAMFEHVEEPVFRERFRGQRALTELDRGPLSVGSNRQLRLYALDGDGTATPRPPVTMAPVPYDEPIREISPAFAHPAALDRLK
jgi:hypothetical protein